MHRISIAIASLVLLGTLSARAAQAEPARAALIIGNATYTAVPGVPACAKSANTVAAAMRALGYQVTERQDASTGGIDGGISEFSQHLATGSAGAFIYVCSYGTDFNDRTFVLPTTARIERPSDILTQGLLAKALLAAVSHDPATVGVVVFDLVAKPDDPPRLGLDALAALAVPDGVAIIAALETSPADRPTPLAAALVAALAGPRVAVGELVSGVRNQLAGSTVAIHMPVRAGILAGSPPTAMPPATAPPTPVAAAPPVVVAPQRQLPEEAQMTEADRRAVQAALARVGYYDNPVDGLFGPETRAAIRRYQHEINAETTGRLTADQATGLVNSR